jgi:hypothetical protein
VAFDIDGHGQAKAGLVNNQCSIPNQVKVDRSRRDFVGGTEAAKLLFDFSQHCCNDFNENAKTQ